jgi:c-di-GMP-binding flagellar brake protein YcgR
MIKVVIEAIRKIDQKIKNEVLRTENFTSWRRYSSKIKKIRSHERIIILILTGTEATRILSSNRPAAAAIISLQYKLNFDCNESLTRE